MSTNSLYAYGSPNPLPEQIPLRAGPLSLLYENGDLRYLKLGEYEVVRRLYVAVRDRNWGTLLPTYSNIEMEINTDSFAIRYDVTNQQGEIDFRWHGEITGAQDGTIRYSMTGKAHSTFLRNRIGFCLLHPMAVAGARARVVHVDGSRDELTFPVHIAPQHVIAGEIKPVIPFNEMRSVAHEVSPGVWAEVEFAGETFEMEDQRNWTDASFKTYGTPLRLPFPAEVTVGTQIEQAITLRLVREGKQGRKGEREKGGKGRGISVSVDQKQIRPLPALGLGVASHGQPLDRREITRLKALGLAHLRLDLKLDQSDYPLRLRQVSKEAKSLGVKLEVALRLSDAAAEELKGLVKHVRQFRPPVSSWLVFHQREKTTSARWVEMARKALTGYDAQAKIGAGTNIYFTDLNRDRPPIEALDLVAYSVNPQVHAFDNSSLVETLAAQAESVRSARQFCADLPLVVSPITLQPRFNPNATGPEAATAPGELPAQVDVRQLSLFGAGWTLGSIKYLAESGAASATYYETTGWRGVMEQAEGSPLPDKFPSVAGGVYPLYHVFADVGDFAGGNVVMSQSSEPLKLEALTVSKAGKQRILLANLVAEPQVVTLRGLIGTQVKSRGLNLDSVVLAIESPQLFRRRSGRSKAIRNGEVRVTLAPFETLRLDMV